MKKINKQVVGEYPLDDYERELEAYLAKGDFVPVDNFEESKKELEEMAKNFLELQGRESVTIRVNKKNLLLTKIRAKKQNLPYQTAINLLINNYAEGKIRLSI